MIYKFGETLDIIYFAILPKFFVESIQFFDPFISIFFQYLIIEGIVDIETKIFHLFNFFHKWGSKEINFFWHASQIDASPTWLFMFYKTDFLFEFRSYITSRCTSSTSSSYYQIMVFFYILHYWIIFNREINWNWIVI